MLEASTSDVPAFSRLSALTRRELEVLALTSDGLTNAMAADRLGLTVHSVKFHLGSIFRKLDVKNRTEAAAVYFSSHSHSGGGQDGKVASWI